MKKISIIKLLFKRALFGFSCVLLMGSCAHSDLLERTDPSSVDDAKAWTSPYLTKLGMNGVYAALRQGVDKDNGATNREIYQYDQFGTGQTLSNGGGREILWGGASTSNGIFFSVWKDLYEGISRSCDAITNIPLKSECDENTKTKYVAEAKFLRAFFYTRLNQLYRGVPIYDVSPTMDDCMRPRSTEAEVWTFVIKDLTDCINIDEKILPNKYAKGNTDYGKVTRGAAYALRGKVYMYTGEWAKAIEDFKQVEKCGYSLFKGNYKDLFKEENEQSEEMIFSLQNLGVPNNGSSQHFHFGTRSSFGGCWNTVGVTASSVDRYENADGSEFNWDNIIPGYTAMKASNREVFFLRDTLGLAAQLIASGAFEKEQDARKMATAIREKVESRLAAIKDESIRKQYLGKGNEARIKKAYENRDPRLLQSVITPYSEYIGVMSNKNHVVTMRWPFYSENPPLDDMKSDNVGDLYYFHRKFVYEGVGLTNRGLSPIDLPLIRYADVLLMRAEAHAELNQLSEAVTCVNEVRGRAGLALLNSSPKTTVSSKAELVKRIRNERRVEFLGEGISYFDELRWKTWKETIFSVDKHGNEPGRQQCYGNAQRSYSYDGDKLLTWPIPANEREMNPSLTQNKDW